MRIVLFSDSHGHISNMVSALNKCGDFDMVIHLGDYARDALKLEELYEGVPFEYVQGNNDWSLHAPSEKFMEIGGKRVFITHGHLYGVKYGYSSLVQKGKSLGADAVFFGHTHVPEELIEDGMLVLNPGSIGAPSVSGKPVFCIVEVGRDGLKARFMGV